jgi:hypothetical protein
MALSGLTSSSDNLVLSGALLYIDDDTNASGIISGETLGMAGEYAELFAGKGVKTRVIRKARSMSISFKANWHEITPKAINIFYGGSYSTDTGKTIVDYKNGVVQPTAHKFTIKAENVNGQLITITFYNAVNSTFGEIPMTGDDFTSLPIEITPEPLTPGDSTEIQVRVELADEA